MLRSCIYIFEYIHHNIILNVVLISANQILAFFDQIVYLFANRYSYFETAGYPACCRKATEARTNQRSEEKNSFSNYVARQIGDTLTVELNLRALIYMR
jgi:hypothetical protein